MSGEVGIYRHVKHELDAVSPSFCLAKWKQVTLHLQNGHNHSCHHPSTHFTPIEEINADPAALHSTRFKIEQQQKMLDGIRPAECQYCWNVEDLPGEYFSDRVMKSSDIGWAGIDIIPQLMADIKAGKTINPSYVEVSFSNVCNFMCSYCSPVHSSRWVSDIENNGPIHLSQHAHNNLSHYKQHNQMPIHHTSHNPYVEAFWKWWPELVKTLKVFRITGGEPLLDKNTFKVMDRLLRDEPRPELEFSINSNACIPDAQLSMYIQKMKTLIDEGRIRRHVFYTSVDGHGAAAEYGRSGLNYQQWLTNVDRVLTELPTVKCTIMCTANIFSVTSFHQLLKDVMSLKLKHRSSQRQMAITIDTSILRWPRHQSVAILPESYAELLTDALAYMVDNREANGKNQPYHGFFDFEVEKFKRFVETVKQPPHHDEFVNLSAARRDFAMFVSEHDSRRGTNFATTFPELVPFYQSCIKELNSVIASSR